MKKLTIGLVAATIALAVCGSSSKSANSPTNGTPTTTKAGGSGGNDFSDQLAKAKSANFKITYSLNGGSSTTIAQDGKGKTLLKTGDSTIINDGSTAISCSGTGSDATCTELGSAGAAAGSAATSLFTAAYASLGALNSSVFNGHTSSETIAGRDATCVTVKASDVSGPLGGAISKVAGDASVTACVDKDTGALLKYSTTGVDGKQSDQFVATEFGESSPSDFEPPVTPKTLPSIPGNLTIPSIPAG